MLRQKRVQKLISTEKLMEYCVLELGHKLDRVNQIWIEDANVAPEGKGLVNIQILGNEFYSDRYNDSALLLERLDDDRFEVRQCCWGTNEPGVYYTQNRLNAGGAARIAFGYHRAWALGLHRGYPALTQCRDLKVYRDANNNGIRDDRLVVASANSGINIHHGGNSPTIGRYSAGCLVRQTIKNHEDFMGIIRKYPNPDKLYGVSVVDPIKLFDWIKNNG